jgi:Uncharacterised protein family (UPF0158)
LVFLNIKLEDLIEALTTNVDRLGGGWFLDTETGAILLDSDAIDDLPEDLEDNPRYLAIYPIPSHESFQIMEDFVANLGDTIDARRLADALNRPKPFRQFKDTLCDYSELREAWFAFEQKEYARLVEEWCEENRIKVEWV